MNRLQRELARSAIRGLTYRAVSRVPPGVALAILIGLLLGSMLFGVDIK